MGKKSDLTQGAEVGSSAFAQLTAWVLWFVVLDAATVLASLPGFIVAIFLDRSLGNLPLLVLCLLPVGPAVAAMLFAWRRRDVDGPDLSPAKHFWRGYRLNVVDVLKWWVPYLLVIAAMVFICLNVALIGWPSGTVWMFAGLGAILTLLAGHLMVITALFSFPTGDALRLSVVFAVKHWRVTLGDICLLAAMVLLTRWLGEWATALAASVIGVWWLRLARPSINDAMENFVRPEEDGGAGGNSGAGGKSGAGEGSGTGEDSDAVDAVA